MICCRAGRQANVCCQKREGAWICYDEQKEKQQKSQQQSSKKALAAKLNDEQEWLQGK
jgi:hypothetical protein